MRRFRLSALALVASFAALTPAGAAPMEPAALAGWWIAVDESVLGLPWEDRAGYVELLAIAPDGAIEDRYLLTRPPLLSGACLRDDICSDAPLVRRGLLAGAEDALSFSAIEDGPGRLARGTVADFTLRAAAVTSRGGWSAAVDAEGGRLTLSTAGAKTRVFARIEPTRLARLRAGFLFLPGDFSSWPCFLATATAGEPAFAGLPPTGHAPLPGFEGFLHTASYSVSALEMQNIPTPDDRFPADRRPADFPVEAFVAEPFADIHRPRNQLQKRGLFSRGVYIGAVAAGRSADEARREAMIDNIGRPVSVPVSDDAIREFATFQPYRFDQKAAAAVGLACAPAEHPPG